MIVNKKYKIELYKNQGLIGELDSYFSFDYSEEELNLPKLVVEVTTNEKNKNIINQITNNVEVRLSIKKGEIFYLFFAGLITGGVDSSVDEKNVHKLKFNCLHYGELFSKNIYFQKNYIVAFDETDIVQDFVIYSQTPQNYLDKDNAVVDSIYTDLGITNSTLNEPTGYEALINFDKETSVFDALKKITEQKTDNNKYFYFTPSLTSHEYRTLRFGNLPSKLPRVLFFGKRRYLFEKGLNDNIKSIKITTNKVFNYIRGTGKDGLISIQTTNNLEKLKVDKIQQKTISFDNVTGQEELNLLTQKELEKNEEEAKIVEIEILENDPQIGMFGVHDLISVKFEDPFYNLNNINSTFRVKSVNIQYNDKFLESCKIKISNKDYPELTQQGLTPAFLTKIIKMQQEKINNIQQTLNL